VMLVWIFSKKFETIKRKLHPKKSIFNRKRHFSYRVGLF